MRRPSAFGLTSTVTAPRSYAAPNPVAAYCRELGLPEPVAEYTPLTGRRFRVDYGWPDDKVGLEVDGGMFGGGRHGGKRSVVRDLEKRNLLTVAGWRVIHVTPSQLWQSQTWAWLRALLEGTDE